MAIRAVIFDFDGLILDTETPDFEAWREIFASHEQELPLDWWNTVLGTASTSAVIYNLLESLTGRQIDREAIQATRRPRFQALLQREQARPGVFERLAEARELGLALGIASSSPREWVEGHLDRLGLRGWFQCVTCREDAPRAKPDPDLYLACVAALGAEPREAIAFEDSPNGVAAARAAGMFAVAVPNPLTARLSLDHAHLRINSLADVRLAELAALALLRD